jgi:uncharacterized membrane protein
MKRVLLLSIFVFSIGINLAVGATLLWNLWCNPTPSGSEPEIGPTLTRDDMRVITSAWPPANQATMRETREKLRQKKLEILELITRNPGDINALQPKIDELIALRTHMEGQALQRIADIMSQIPPEKRGSLLGFLQNRTCMGMGPGIGLGCCPNCGYRMGPGGGPGYRMHERTLQQRGGPQP